MLAAGSPMAGTVDSKVCSVCGLEVAIHMEAWCGNCGLLYHLNQRADLPGDDCGQVWINEEHLSLEFACNTCLNPVPAGLDDVLDAGEAALVAGIAESALLEAAGLGQVKHRRTGSGTVLFRRSDIVEFVQGQR